MAGAKDAKEKPDKQILILSMDLKAQETTEMWQSRTQGGLRKEQYFIDSAVRSHGEQGLMRTGDKMLGDAVTWTVNWHHNGNQKRAKHPLYTSNDPQFIVIDARDGDDSDSVHASSYTTLRGIIESETNKLKNSLRVGGDLLLKYLSEKTPNPIIICVVDQTGLSNAPFVAESLHGFLKTQLETSRKISLKHLNQEGLPKKCKFQKPCRICVVGEDGPTSEKASAIYRRNRESTDNYIYQRVLYPFLEVKEAHRTETALGSMKSSGAKDTKATPPKRERSRGRSRDRKRRSHAKEKDIEHLDIDELEQMESKIKEQIKLKKMMSIEKEPAKKSKKHERKEEPKEGRQEKKPRTEPKEEPKDEEEEEAPDYSAPDDAIREVRAESRDETSGSESVSENIKAQIRRDLESSDDEKRQGRYRTGGVHLRSRSPARDDRQPNSPEGQPAWKREEHRYYKDWRGGKGKSKSKTKEKGRGKSKSV